MTASGRLLAVRRLAWACAALVFTVTSLSAFVRLARAAGPGGPGERAIEIARGAHRVSASLALVLAIVALVQCYVRQPTLPRAGRLALGVVGLGVLLAILGRFAGTSASGAVVLANLGGGFAMLALACGLALETYVAAPAPASRTMAWLAPAALAVLALQAALGALSAAQQGTPRCAEFVCGIHLAVAAPAALACVALGVIALRRGRRTGGALLVALALGQVALGLGMRAAGVPFAPALAHNMVAAGLVAAAAAVFFTP